MTSNLAFQLSAIPLARALAAAHNSPEKIGKPFRVIDLEPMAQLVGQDVIN